MDPLATIKRVVAGGARYVGRGFIEPDADWAPVVMALDLRVPALAPTMLPDDVDLAAAVGAALGVLGQRRCPGMQAAAVLSSCWTVAARTLEERDQVVAWARDHGGLEHYPGRAEKLLIYAAVPARLDVIEAPIIRSPDGPPQLGAWDEYVDVPWNSLGDVPRALLHGLRTTPWRN